MTMMHTEELAQANHSFLAKILHAKRMTIQDGRLDEGTNDPSEKNEELPDKLSRGSWNHQQENITEYLHQGGVFREKSLTLCSPDQFTLGWFTCLDEYD